MLLINTSVEKWKCSGCGEPLDKTTDNFTEFDLKRGNHECRNCHALRIFMSEHSRHDQLEMKAQVISIEQAAQYQTLNTALAKKLGFTRSSTVKGFVYADELAVFKYFEKGKWFLAISQTDARHLIAQHTKERKEVPKRSVGDTDTCGLCGGKWTVRCNIHKSVLANGIELFCCTRCRNVREVCDDSTILRKIADGLERVKK